MIRKLPLAENSSGVGGAYRAVVGSGSSDVALRVEPREGANLLDEILIASGYDERTLIIKQNQVSFVVN